MASIVPTLILSVLLSACGGNGIDALAAVSAEPAGAHCANGGSKIETGLDASGNGTLEAAEVGSTEYACNSAAANGLNALVQVLDEPSGAHCAAAGKAINVGVDSNANGVLDASEISATSYACNGAPGAGLNWVNVTGAAVQAQPNTGYIASNEAAQVVVMLPDSVALAIGDVVRVSGAGLGGWVIAQNAGQAVNTRNLGGMPGAVWTAREFSRPWASVASSADGSMLVAVEAGGQIHTSSDSGATWTARGSNGNWFSVASSTDGSKLVAVEQPGLIYTSSDSGATWTARESNRNWSWVASSSDGSKLVAVERGGLIYASSDSGATWAPRLSNRSWNWVASSADGSKWVADEWNGQIYTSGDSSVSWTPHGPTGTWGPVASSADGRNLVASQWDGQIYTSSDSGVSWTPRESNRSWASVASSADGSKLVAVVYGGQIHTSSDGGVSWTPHESNRSWASVASSADGSKLVAAVVGGQIYTSSTRTTTTPGTGGSISGSSSDAIELIYLGHGRFNVLSHEGDLTVQ